MVPYMAAGYAVDRAMGGNGMTGLAVGTGVGGFGTGAFAGALGTGAGTTTGAMTTAAATEAAASTTPLLFSAPASAGGSGLGAVSTGLGGTGTLGSVNPLTTGGFSESISPFTPLGGPGVGGNVGFFGQPISNQVMNSSLTGEKGLLGYGLENTFENTFVEDGFDFINEGYEGMSLMDKINVGVTGNSVIDNMTADTTVPIQAPPPQTIAAKEPTISSPLAIDVQAPNRSFVQDPRKLYEERMYG